MKEFISNEFLMWTMRIGFILWVIGMTYFLFVWLGDIIKNWNK